MPTWKMIMEWTHQSRPEVPCPRLCPCLLISVEVPDVSLGFVVEVMQFL